MNDPVSLRQLGGAYSPLNCYPMFHPEVRTVNVGEQKITYLDSPGVVMLCAPRTDLSGVEEFLQGLGFGRDYIDEYEVGFDDTGDVDHLALLSKFLGQLCYMSFGPKRTSLANIGSYFEGVLSSKHGSVVEHGSYTFLIYGVGRDFTHELVRHRVGTAFSQVSQRYVNAESLRFVMRPEYRDDPMLTQKFFERCARAAQTYKELTDILYAKQAAGDPSLTSDQQKASDARKRVQQAARSVLPNEVEAPIGISVNVRALRHILEMRVSRFADTPIREAFLRVFAAIREFEPTLFQDFAATTLKDGSVEIAPRHSKV